MSANCGWSPLSLPCLESFDETTIRINALSFAFDVGECWVVRHGVMSDEVCYHDGRTTRYALHCDRNQMRRYTAGGGEAIHLLAMYQYVLAPSKSVVNIFTSTLQFTPEICAWYIEDINPVTLEAVFLCYGEPWYIEDLNEMGDLVFVKNRFFHRRGQRSKV